MIFICPIKTLLTFFRLTFFKTTEVSISQSSFLEQCGIIFGKFFSASSIDLESKVLFEYPNGCQNLLIVATKFIASLVAPCVLN